MHPILLHKWPKNQGFFKGTVLPILKGQNNVSNKMNFKNLITTMSKKLLKMKTKNHWKYNKLKPCSNQSNAFKILTYIHVWSRTKSLLDEDDYFRANLPPTYDMEPLPVPVNEITGNTTTAASTSLTEEDTTVLGIVF